MIATTTVRALLSQTKVGALKRPPKVIVIDSKTPLLEAFQTLLDHNLLSAPVYDGEKKVYTGFLDIRDLVSFVVFVYDEQKVEDNNTLKDILRHGEKMFSTPTTDGVTVSYLSRRNKFIQVMDEDTLLKVTEILSHGVHRVPVIDKDGNVVSIVSQSNVVAFLNSHLQQLGNQLAKSINEIKIGSSPVESVIKTATVIDTLRLMDVKMRSGIALVDASGRLVGTTTGKDLKLFIKNPTLSALKSPIFNFLNEVRAQLIDIKSPTISVFGTDTLALAIGKLAATSVHRVFVVNNEKEYKAVAVVSITDILKFIFSLQ